jgi:hypothetical protein
MPMAATPFAHAGELPVATKCTGEVEVFPLFGEETVTMENAGAVDKQRHTNVSTRPKCIPTSPGNLLASNCGARAASCRDSRTVAGRAPSKFAP